MTQAQTRSLHLEYPLDLTHTLSLHVRGRTDPTMRLEGHQAWRASRNDDGAVCLRLEVTGKVLEAAAWGPGAARALDTVGALVGAEDDTNGFEPANGRLRDLHRRLAGLRIGRTGAVVEAIVPAILEQKVTGLEARRAFRRLVLRFGEPAPGPGGLMLPPAPEVLAQQPYYALHPVGVERRRAETIREVCRRARAFEGTAGLRREEAQRRLSSVRGVGAWTVAEVALRAFGDADAVSVGDFHIPNLVSWALAGEPRGTDERMLELLEPYAGHRGRVIRLLEAGARRPPAFGARLAARDIARI